MLVMSAGNPRIHGHKRGWPGRLLGGRMKCVILFRAPAGVFALGAKITLAPRTPDIERLVRRRRFPIRPFEHSTEEPRLRSGRQRLSPARAGRSRMIQPYRPSAA